MNNSFTSLGGVSVEAFLEEYWQKKPLLVRQAFPEFESPITPDELAGLTLDEDVESRLVIEDSPEGPWQLLRGPFEEKDFQQLPPDHWTLLVQAVDQWVPEMKAVLEKFAFLPNWRLDDLMVSYAPKGGSVGPHFDYYDVFLIQGHGKRRWQVGNKCDDDSPRLNGTSLRILKQFETEHEWVLEPGDMLYLPAQYSHHGVAMDSCMTYSVGFRAPSVAQIIDDLATEAISHCKDHQRYRDPAIKGDINPGEIPATAIGQLKNIIGAALLDDQLLQTWFGRYMTSRKYPDLDLGSYQDAKYDWEKYLQSGRELSRHPASRFAFCAGIPAQLFVDGEVTEVEQAFAELLCSNKALNRKNLATFINNNTDRNVLAQLVEYGALFMPDEHMPNDR